MHQSHGCSRLGDTYHADRNYLGDSRRAHSNRPVGTSRDGRKSRADGMSRMGRDDRMHHDGGRRCRDGRRSRGGGRNRGGGSSRPGDRNHAGTIRIHHFLVHTLFDRIVLHYQNYDYCTHSRGYHWARSHGRCRALAYRGRGRRRSLDCVGDYC